MKHFGNWFFFLAAVAFSAKLKIQQAAETAEVQEPTCDEGEVLDGHIGTCDGLDAESCHRTWTNIAPGRYQECKVSGSKCLAEGATCKVIVPQAPAFQQVFTSCGATGYYGPTQAQCDQAYGGQKSVFVPEAGGGRVNRGYQVYEIPETAEYMILAAGAAGGQVGQGIPGKGAVVSAQFTLAKGTKLVMTVGQKGEDGDSCNDGGGGGGGASTVAILGEGTDRLTHKSPDQIKWQMVKPLLVAGGGSGNDDDVFWGCKQISAPGMDGGLLPSGKGGIETWPDRGPCDSQGAGFRGRRTNRDKTFPFIKGAQSEYQGSWRESGGFGGGASSCNAGGGGGGYVGGRTNEKNYCRKPETWDPETCTSGGTSYMAPEGLNWLAHGAFSRCNGYIIIETCSTEGCKPWEVPGPTFGEGCTWTE